MFISKPTRLHKGYEQMSSLLTETKQINISAKYTSKHLKKKIGCLNRTFKIKM